MKSIIYLSISNTFECFHGHSNYIYVFYNIKSLPKKKLNQFSAAQLSEEIRDGLDRKYQLTSLLYEHESCNLVFA